MINESIRPQSRLEWRYMGIIISLIASMISVGLSAYLIPGVEVASVWTLLWVAIVMGIINAFIKPVVQLLALPITILTLGLFALVINAILVLLVATIVPGFQVDGFWVALLFSIVLSIVNAIIGMFID